MMSDMRADDEDRLPWLEAVDEEDIDEGPSVGKLAAFVIIGLAAIGLIVGGLFWMNGSDDAGTGADQTLIAAPAGDYKVKPDDPGGMKVDAKDETALAASQGETPEGRIDVEAVPETPVTAQPKAAPAPAPTPTAPPAATPAVPASSGGTIQLGAFDSNAQANAAWKALSARFKYLEPLGHSVMTAEVNGRTFYRLRASGPGARDVCRRLEVAGETCLVVN